MKDNVGYKVVRRIGDTLVSCIVDWLALQVYVKDEWASAPYWLAKDGYHLTFFTHEDSVRNFILGNTHSLKYKYIEVWTCLVDGVIKTSALPDRLEIEHLERGFKSTDLVTVGFSIRNRAWPTGTAMAERLKLVRDVSYTFFGVAAPGQPNDILEIAKYPHPPVA